MDRQRPGLWRHAALHRPVQPRQRRLLAHAGQRLSQRPDAELRHHLHRPGQPPRQCTGRGAHPHPGQRWLQHRDCHLRRVHGGEPQTDALHRGAGRRAEHRCGAGRRPRRRRRRCGRWRPCRRRARLGGGWPPGGQRRAERRRRPGAGRAHRGADGHRCCKQHGNRRSLVQRCAPGDPVGRRAAAGRELR